MKRTLHLRVTILFLSLLLVVQSVQAQAQNSATNAQPASPAAPQQPEQTSNFTSAKGFVLEDAVPVRLRFNRTVSSADAHVGDTVDFEVLQDISVNGTLVVPKGGIALGTVTEAQPKRRMARGGKLEINVDYVKLANGDKAALRSVKGGNGGGHVGMMTAGIVATGLIFFPAAPFFLFMHGKDITIPQGTEVTAFVDGDMHLDMAKFGVQPPPLPPPAAAPQSLAILVIDSSPPAADIEIDGAFAGSTPSTINVASGSHDVRIKKSGFADWDRELNVSGGTIHLTADFSSEAPALAPASPVAPNAAPSPAVTPIGAPAAAPVPHS